MSCPPVLLIVFKRPEKTEQVLRAIGRARPERLYVAADGPRHEGERDKCLATRAVIDQVDWDCEVRTLYHESNLGCRRAVIAALDWFFANEPMGIILEDDCLPVDSFFPFCETMLDRYRNDGDVGLITGTSYADPDAVEDSYYFSDYGCIWGWASWARVWKHYDPDIRAWRTLRSTDFLKKLSGGDVGFVTHWRYVFDSFYSANPIDTWDYQLFFMIFLNRLKTVMPKYNLIRNIGAGEDATHHMTQETMYHERETGELDFPLSHPKTSDVNPRLIRNYLGVYDYRRFLIRHVLKTILPEPVQSLVKSIRRTL